MAEQRSNIYNFLSLVYSKEPTAEFLDSVLQEDMVSALKDLGVVFDDCFKTMPKEALLEELVSEYTRLFIGVGPYHVPPYEAVYVDVQRNSRKKGFGLMWGKSSQDVVEFYAQNGYEPLLFYKDTPDHIGVELGFMSKLAQQENKLDAQAYFLNEHLTRWVGAFCEKVADFSNLEFYKSLAYLTKEFVLQDREEINTKLTPEPQIA